MLRPDWLKKFGEPQPAETIEGVECDGFGFPGAATKIDAMFFAPVNASEQYQQRRICQYHEVLSFSSGQIFHDITYHKDSWRWDVAEEDLIAPVACQTACPRQFPSMETFYT
eukprot:NODE_17237_length_954_cov_3.570738.p4 GENE.NODE_17237_length_954_cov_3.570738~~NODE_17237_length_954_cov_3.570738.p4  ORF type:complete len:112 (+),score=14.14 NODE_17237_length_954_cov_3.570738:421-756(+)